MPGWGMEAFATSLCSPISLFVPAKQKMAYIIHKISIICARNKYIMILRTGRSRETGFRWWRNHCGSTTLLDRSAVPVFLRTLVIGKPVSEIIVFIILPMPTTKREKMGLLTKRLFIYFGRKNGSKKDAHWRHPIHLIILFKFKAVAERRQGSSAASKPRRKTRVKLCPHF